MTETERMPDLRIVICMTSHNRIDCARINQEIIKLNYGQPMAIVHASSSPNYSGYIEDAFVRCAPMPLHAGAVNLLQTALRVAAERFPAARYFVHLESDTWLLDESVIHRYIERLDATGGLLATCAWSSPGGSKVRRLANLASMMVGAPRVQRRRLAPITDLATQFFIIRHRDDVLATILDLERDPHVKAEQAFFDAYVRRFPVSTVVRMVEREPVDPFNRYGCDAQSLYCQHWPARDTAKDPRHWSHALYVRPHYDGKRESLLKHPEIRHGEHLNRLLSASDLSYYNEGALRY